MCACDGCDAPADLITAHDNLTTELQQAATKQTETEAQLADIKAQGELLTKELQESRQAAETAAEEASAAKEELQEAKVRATSPRSIHQHYQQHAPATSVPAQPWISVSS
jgi:predicted  nucleic acid-binding Zn-ribbon protein